MDHVVAAPTKNMSMLMTRITANFVDQKIMAHVLIVLLKNIDMVMEATNVFGVDQEIMVPVPIVLPKCMKNNKFSEERLKVIFQRYEMDKTVL